MNILSARDGRSTPSPALIPTPRIALVGCGKTKLAHEARARDLYTGALFRAALSHALATANETFIVSGAHGLVELDAVLPSYDLDLATLGKHERQAWGDRLVERLCADARRRSGHVTIYAGAFYANPLIVELRRRRVSFAWPLRRMALGHQLRWFSAQRQERDGDRS